MNHQPLESELKEHPVVWRKIEDLTLWEDNPRKISKAELDRLKRSLERDPDFMQAMPIVLSDRTGKLVIISGNQRYKGCKELGWKEVPTVLFHCKTEEEEVRKAMIANQSTVTEETEIDPDKMNEDELRKAVKKMLALPSTVQRYDKPNRNELHPTEKPVKLVSYLISNSTKPNAKVLDTFGGSGTTLIACEQLGRHCYMMELDPKYCARIIKRWKKITGEKAEKLK